MSTPTYAADAFLIWRKADTEKMEPSRFFKKYGPLLVSVAVMLFLDQYTKMVIRSSFSLGESVSVIDGFFNLTYILNSGAAFSFLADTGKPWVGRFFIIASIAAIVIIIFIYREVEDNRPLKIALTLIMGGAGGNLIDRVLAGKVTDFLDFHIAGHHWPVFNVADSCITIGVTIIIVQSVFEQYGAEKPDS